MLCFYYKLCDNVMFDSVLKSKLDFMRFLIVLLFFPPFVRDLMDHGTDISLDSSFSFLTSYP